MKFNLIYINNIFKEIDSLETLNVLESMEYTKREIKALQEENLGLRTALERKNNEVELWMQKFRNETVNRPQDFNDLIAEYDQVKKLSIV